MAISPHFRGGTRTAALATLVVAVGCTTDSGPPGGQRPALATVPERPSPRYDAFEQTVLRDALDAAAGATREALETGAARRSGRTPAAAAVLPPPPATPPPPPAPPPVPDAVRIEDDMVTADGLIQLAEAVQRDRSELLRREQATAQRAAEPEPVAERVTVVAFPPGAAELTDRERQRLARALDGEDPSGLWIVRTGGDLAEPRARAVEAALAALGVPDDASVTAPLGRDVDVAEIAVRR